MEFRGFCYKGKLNALSQYHHLMYSPKLLEMKESLGERILNYFETDVKPKFSTLDFSYIIDFAVTKDKIWVIELNPFLETTDGCLFSWQKV